MPLCLALLLFGATVYEREINISNPAQVVQTDVQIQLDLDLSSLVAAGKIDSKLNALRFFRGDNPLSCWVDNTPGNCPTRIWLKIDTLIPGEQKISLIYSDSTDGHLSLFDSVFTKINIDSASGWVFHCDESEGAESFPQTCADPIALLGVAWDNKDGGVWGKRQDVGFSSGSALVFRNSSFARWNAPQDMGRDSFTLMLWMKLDTLGELAWSSSRRVILEKPDAFSLWLKGGTIGFSLQKVANPGTLYLAPFGWERTGAPKIPSGYVPQGLATVGDKLLLSGYRTNPLSSRVWLIDPLTLGVLEWFEMPPEATHTSGLACDSARSSVWAADYDSGKIYEIDLEKSFLNHHAVVLGQFALGEKGVSACCFAPVNDTLRLIVSTWSSAGRTYVVDAPASVEQDTAVILGSYQNVGYSQGLAFDGASLWESGIAMAQFNLERALEQGNYQDGLISYWPEVPQPEGITFIRDTLWAINEYMGKDFFRLTGDPREHIGRWMHLAVTYDGTNLVLYRDGEPMDSMFVGSYSNGWESAPLYIGGLEGGKSSFQGSIDEIAFLNMGSNPEEILAHFERRTPLVIQPDISFATEEKVSSGDESVSGMIDSLGIETSSTTLKLRIPYEKSVAVALYDVSGRRAAVLLAPQKVRGKLELSWPRNIPAGVYHVLISSEGCHASRKIVLLR